jgi:hypothetical protein
MNDVQSPVLESAAPAGLIVDDPLWYKDAVIYQLNVKSFFDSNDDGIGDFQGLTSKLGYIRDLGVNTIWLMPFYPSPLKDDGYDIAYYTDIITPRISIRGFNPRAERPQVRPSAIFTSGATPIRNTWARESFSSTRRVRTGPGIRWPKLTTGTAFSPINPI